MNADSEGGGGDGDFRVHWVILAVAVLATVLVHAPHGLPFNWDDQGQYLSHARALIEGRPYTDIGFIYTTYNNFIGPVAEPPGFPVLIAPALAISGPGLVPVRGVLVVSLILLLWLTWRFVESRAGMWNATAATLMSLGVLSSLHTLDGIMSDLPFLAAICGVIVAADEDGPLSRRRLVVMAVAGALAFSFRMAALPLLPAMMLMILGRPRREWKGLSLVGLVWIVAAALSMFAVPAASALGGETSRDWSKIVHDMRLNLVAIRFGFLDTTLYPFGSNLGNDVWHGVAALLAMVGLWQVRRTGLRRFAWQFAFSCLVMLILLPTRSSRYWWPMVPLQSLLVVGGFAYVLRAVRFRAIPQWTPTFLVAVLFAFASRRAVPEPAVPFAKREDVAAVIAALHEASPEEYPRVAIYSPRLLTWHTRIPAMGQFEATPDQVLAELRDKKIAFLVRGSLGEFPIIDAAVDLAVAQRPDGYQRLGTYGGLTLFRVIP